MIYKKKVSVGQFAKKDVDYKNGDMVTIANEGKQVEGEWGMRDVFLVKLGIAMLVHQFVNFYERHCYLLKEPAP